MQKVMTWFERIIISALILLMATTVLFSAVDLAWLLIKELIAPPCFRMDVNRPQGHHPRRERAAQRDPVGHRGHCHHAVRRVLPLQACLPGGMPPERRETVGAGKARIGDAGPQ